MRGRNLGVLGWSLAVGLWVSGARQAAACPVGTVIEIDNDKPSSGYSEESANWDSWATSPCKGPTYRYLSKYVGDGSRKGKAIWKPKITVAGHYKVSTGFRATENRTDDADYYVYDDSGSPAVHKEVDQRGDACQWVDLSVAYCVPGGNCRLVLHGDDGKSDEADVTQFKLVDCDGGGPVEPPKPGRCDGIRAVATYEVCQETDTTCAGTFNDGAGCLAYCAAAGMTCKARFGGEPGCSKEPQNPQACGEKNGHLSDWCECEGPPLPSGMGGSGGSAGTTGAAGDPGAAGMTGTAGTNGGAGEPGGAGMMGTAGMVGAAGETGAAGTTGAAGDQGAAGTTGAAGMTGSGGLAGTGGTTGAGGVAGGVSGASGATMTGGAAGASQRGGFPGAAKGGSGGAKSVGTPEESAADAADEGGCGCHVVGGDRGPSRHERWVMLGVTALITATARRRRRDHAVNR